MSAQALSKNASEVEERTVLQRLDDLGRTNMEQWNTINGLQMELAHVKPVLGIPSPPTSISARMPWLMDTCDSCGHNEHPGEDCPVLGCECTDEEE